MEQVVTSWQQPWKVTRAVAESQLTHKGEGKAEIQHVLVGNVAQGGRVEQVFAMTKFCPSSTRITRIKVRGDGAAIPEDLEVVIVGLEKVQRKKLPTVPGFYTIKGVTVSANGRCEIRCSKKTRFEFSHSCDETEMALANI